MPELYLMTAPEEAQRAANWGLPLAHLAYGMGRDRLELTVGALSLTARGGWMVLTDEHLPEQGSLTAFAAQLKQECRRRRYTAVLADFESAANDRAFAVLEVLAQAELPLIVPPCYGEALPAARVLLDSAISGGSIEEYFREASARWPGRLCLALHRLRMRFPLPAECSEGELLSKQELEALLSERQSYFSRELGCRYCTVHEGERFAFILYDDAASLRHKLMLADQFDIGSAVALFPEVEDVLPEMIGT